MVTQSWQAVGDTVSDFAVLGIVPQIFRADSYVFNHLAERPVPIIFTLLIFITKKRLKAHSCMTLLH